MSDYAEQIKLLLIDTKPVWSSRTTSLAQGWWDHLRDMMSHVSVRRRQLFPKHFIDALKKAHKKGYITENEVLKLQEEVTRVRENRARKSPGMGPTEEIVEWLDIVPEKVRDKYLDLVSFFLANEEALNVAKSTHPDIIASAAGKFQKIYDTGYTTLTEIADIKRMLKSLVAPAAKRRVVSTHQHQCVDGVISLPCHTYRGRKYVEIKGKRVFI